MFRLQMLLIAAWMSIVTTVTAQHTNSWFRTTLSYPLTEKIKIDGELQHRRQTGWESNNPLDKNLMYTLRNWVHYQHSQHLKFSLSPFTYFYHYRVIEQKTDETLQPNREYRLSVAADLQLPLDERLSLINRSAAEYRMFMGNPTHITRLRHRLGFRYQLNHQIKIGVYDELFVNLSGATRNHFYDHNRIAIPLEFSFSRSCKLETGYIFANRLLPYNTYRIKENNFYFNLSYQLK